MSRTRARIASVGALTVALAAAATLVVPAAHAAPPDPPILKKWANPGIAKVGNGYVMLHTTDWAAKGAAASASKPNGPWKIAKDRPLLTKAPKWATAPAGAKQSRSVWAPSLIRGRNGTWVVYYAAPVRGSSSAPRCIGTGTSTSPLGPFVPDARPIACYKGSGTKPKDAVKNERSTSLIDATPSVVKGQTVLTYKTSHAYKQSGRTMWHTTIRMLRLNPDDPTKVLANPVHKNGASIQLTSVRHKYIEENPSLIYRAGKFTLFTSWGWYGTRDQYWTRYRQSKQLWKAFPKSTRTLGFPKGTRTWGRGNAQAVVGLKKGTWNFFWNGHRPKSVRGEGPKYLYVGKLAWSGGKPRVSKVYKRG